MRGAIENLKRSDYTDLQRLTLAQWNRIDPQLKRILRAIHRLKEEHYEDYPKSGALSKLIYEKIFG